METELVIETHKLDTADSLEITQSALTATLYSNRFGLVAVGILFAASLPFIGRYVRRVLRPINDEMAASLAKNIRPQEVPSLTQYIEQ